MAAYCFLDITEVTDEGAMAGYRDGVRETVERHGGRYLVAGGETLVAEGGWRPGVPVLIEFPSLTDARLWYDSVDYRDLKALRRTGARSNVVFMEGVVEGLG